MALSLVADAGQPTASLTTVLFTDIEGSTTTLEALGDQGWLHLLRTHNDLGRAEVARCAGFEVKTVGDGFMVVFDDAAHGIRCATGIQRALAQHNERAGDHPLRVRMGLHCGTVIEDAGDYHGRA